VDTEQTGTDRGGWSESERRRGTHLQPEVGLPEGFVPPSAALAPAVPEPVVAATADSSDNAASMSSQSDQ